MKLLRICCMGLLILALSVNSGYSDSAGKGKGADNGEGKGRDEQFHEEKGQGNPHSDNARSAGSETVSTRSEGQSVSRGSDPEVRRHSIERDRRQSDLRANLPVRENKGRDAERSLARGKDLAKQDQDRGSKKFEHARWSYNPKDERGQGNMGKVDMRDPYGFDKDSGREGSERGRAIHPEPILNLAEILSIDFKMIDSTLVWYMWISQYYTNLAKLYPYNSIYSYLANYYTNKMNSYVSPYPYDMIAVNYPGTSINYALTLTPPEEFAGTTLLVTTTLTSINDYTNFYWTYNSTIQRWIKTTVDYDAGQAVIQQTQEVVLGTDNTYSFSYDPPTELSGSWGALSENGFYATLSVTVTEPISGASYTIDYDRQIYLYRCPYGKVYDAKSGKAIVGAKVMVFNEDGSIVSLDKASNPTAHNPQTTDATGRFGFKLETNKKYYLKAIAPGYQDFKSPIFTEKWHVLREDIALTPISPLK